MAQSGLADETGMFTKDGTVQFIVTGTDSLDDAARE